MEQNGRTKMYFLGLAAGLFGLDIYLKGRIEAEKREDFPKDMKGTSGKIRLYRNHNDGFCFGLLKQNRELVNTLPLVFTSGVTGIFLWLLTRKSRLVDKLGITLVAAGAWSNLFDRIKRGYVVDYFSFQLGWLKKVVFNIGDLCIFLGTFLLTVSELFSGHGSGTGKKAEKTAEKVIHQNS